MDIKPKIDLTKFTAQELQEDADGWRIATEITYGTDPDEPVNLRKLSLSPNSPALAFVQERVAMYKSRFMKFDNPYGEGNHHRISWRRQWSVDDVALTATHKSTGFVMVFTPDPPGRYTARLGFELPPFGPDGTLAMAQMFGLRELLKDGWEIFHTVMGKK